MVPQHGKMLLHFEGNFKDRRVETGGESDHTTKLKQRNYFR